MHFTAGSRKWYLAIQGGFVEVNNDHVRVLADMAERAEEIDIERARAELRQAQENVLNGSPGLDPAAALSALERAQARVDAASHK
jgi:F-type H+-transporting ATPase subunit epsilon